MPAPAFSIRALAIVLHRLSVQCIHPLDACHQLGVALLGSFGADAIAGSFGG
jgi:hypothetical protein